MTSCRHRAGLDMTVVWPRFLPRVKLADVQSADPGRESPLTASSTRRWSSAVWPVIVSVVTVAAVLSPLARTPPTDSFPLSNYPMFSHNREPVTDIALAVGVSASGTTTSLSPELISGTVEVIVAGSILKQAVRAGIEESASLCRTIAERVATANEGGAIAVEIRVERYDAVAWFAGDHTPEKVTVVAACDVGES